MKNDEQAIRQVIADWHERTRAGDVEAVLAFMTDDAEFLTCGKPPMTKADFASATRKMAGKVQIDSQYEIKQIEISGDLAYVRSYVSLVVSSVDDKRDQRSGDVLSVFRKSAVGVWQLARDANFVS